MQYHVLGDLVLRRRLIFIALTIACVWLAACGSGGGLRGGLNNGGGNTPSGSPVYITDINNASVSAYLINPTSGSLQPATGSPFPTGRSSPDSLTFDPAKKFLLVANSAAASTSVFSVNSSTAALTAVQGSPFTTSANETRLVIHPSATFVYGLSSTPAQIDGYAFNDTSGALSTLSGFPVSLTSTGAMGLTIAPNGAFLYASNPSSGVITSFTIATSGALTLLANTPVVNGSPVYLTFDSSGRFLFAINTSGGATGGGSVSVFSASVTGALTEITGSPFAAGTTPVSALFLNGVLYVVNQTSGTLSAFSLNSTTGQLTAIQGSPYQLGTRPVSVAAAVHGSFLIVTNSTTANVGSISVFSVATDGTLTPVSGSPFIPDVATPDQVAAL